MRKNLKKRFAKINRFYNCKILLHLFLIFIVLVLASFSTAAYFIGQTDVSGNSFSTGASSHSDIVLNEAMVNPFGNENDPMPNGEWVELYNKGVWTVDVTGWYIYDDTSNFPFVITNMNTNTGGTTIPVGGYLAVYRNGQAKFNNDGDSVKLFDGPIATGALIDSMTYTSSTDGKSWARLPNGTGVWSDNHTPTPGSNNI